MATSFPSGLDSFTNPTAVDTLDSPPHDTQPADANDAIEALQAKVGVDGSAVTSSIDYQLNTGYRYHSTLYFTSSGTFSKASYPWLRAIRVKCQGAGGGGGNRNGATECAGGGGGGACAESFITDIASLAASETVTVGAGGAGGATGADNDGAAGGNSSFGTLVIGDGAAATAANATLGGAGGDVAGSTGDVAFSGSFGISGSGSSDLGGGNGGDSPFGGGGRGGRLGGNAGLAGNLYGGGGGGASQNNGGGDGANGIVIVELYA